MNTPYILGIDVSKDTLSVCLIQRSDHTIVRESTLDNNPQAFGLCLHNLPVDCLSDLCICIEPTGSYWFEAADTALSAGCQVVTAPPKLAKRFLRSLNPRAKTDRLDAKGIALYAACMDLKDYSPKAQDIKDLSELLNLRRKLSQNITYFSRCADSKSAGSDIASATLTSLKSQLTQLDKLIRQYLKHFEPAQRLAEVPGFGPVTTSALVCRLSAIDFKSSDAFVAYVGLDLRVKESGKFRGRRMLSHNGDAELRRLLYLAAQSAIRVKDSPFAQIYQRHTSQRQLPSTAAICVVARKMARTAWSMVKFGTKYSTDRVFTDLRA